MEHRIFFGKHIGKKLSELDSGYLIWVIEHYDKADWLLINECKKELSERLKLDWEMPTYKEKELRDQVAALSETVTTLENALFLSMFQKGNPLQIEQNLRDPLYAKEIISLIRQVNL